MAQNHYGNFSYSPDDKKSGLQIQSFSNKLTEDMANSLRHSYSTKQPSFTENYDPCNAANYEPPDDISDLIDGVSQLSITDNSSFIGGNLSKSLYKPDLPSKGNAPYGKDLEERSTPLGISDMNVNDSCPRMMDVCDSLKDQTQQPINVTLSRDSAINYCQKEINQSTVEVHKVDGDVTTSAASATKARKDKVISRFNHDLESSECGSVIRQRSLRSLHFCKRCNKNILSLPGKSEGHSDNSGKPLCKNEVSDFVVNPELEALENDPKPSSTNVDQSSTEVIVQPSYIDQPSSNTRSKTALRTYNQIIKNCEVTFAAAENFKVTPKLSSADVDKHSVKFPVPTIALHTDQPSSNTRNKISILESSQLVQNGGETSAAAGKLDENEPYIQDRNEIAQKKVTRGMARDTTRIVPVPVIVYLKGKLRNLYADLHNWARLPTWLNQCFKLKLSLRNRSVIVGTDELFNIGKKRFLVCGEADFGKSALCALISQKCYRTQKLPFEVCISLKLKEIDISKGLPEMLTEKFWELLDSENFTRVNLENALEKVSEKIVILFDGLDELDVDSRGEVCRSIAGKFQSPFERSTILVTSRPIELEDQFLESFDTHCQILGFQVEHFRSIVKESSSSRTYCENEFKKFCTNARLHFLTCLPPKFLHYAKLVYTTTPERMCMYNLIDNIMYVQVVSEANYQEAFEKIGEVCLKMLALGLNCVSEDALESTLGKHYKLIKKLAIFTDPRQPGNEYLVCSKIILVFFATYFLRCLWNRPWISGKEKEMILKKYFLFGDTIGDFLIERQTAGVLSLERRALAKTNTFFVGVLPEIVLKWKDETYSEFQMYYDVTTAIEMSSAFDSTNLLLRIGPRYLSRFGFMEIKEENEATFQDQFRDVISLLNFDDCTVECKYFFNEYEERNFLALTVGIFDNSTVMQAVIVKSPKTPILIDELRYDKLFIGFLYSNVHNIIYFLCSVLFVPDSVIPLMQCKSPGELIFTLIMIILRLKGDHCVQIAISEGAACPKLCAPKLFVSMVLTTNGMFSSAEYSYQNLSYSEITSLNVKSFERHQLELVSQLNRHSKGFSMPYITLYMK